MKKTPTSKIRALPLQAWMTNMGSGRYSPPLAECSVAYNKDGYYYDDQSKLCWFEYMGRGWVYDAKAFQYDYTMFGVPDQNEPSPIIKDYDKLITSLTNHPLLKLAGNMLLKKYLKAKR